MSDGISRGGVVTPPNYIKRFFSGWLRTIKWVGCLRMRSAGLRCGQRDAHRHLAGHLEPERRPEAAPDAAREPQHPRGGRRCQPRRGAGADAGLLPERPPALRTSPLLHWIGLDDGMKANKIRRRVKKKDKKMENKFFPLNYCFQFTFLLHIIFLLIAFI